MPLGINELDILNEPIEPDVHIVDKILPPGVTLLCGHQKIGKSWLALKLCLCATRGVDLWGYKTLHCKALYCCLEDTKKRIRKRYDALAEAAEELQGTAASGWLDFRFQCPKLDQGLVDELEKHVKDNPECRLIIIDTLLMITPPMSDSPYANDYNNIVALKKFADKYEIAIVLIHHTRKLKAKDPFDEILGTSGLNGAADTMMILTREGRSESRGTLRYTGRDIGDPRPCKVLEESQTKAERTDLSQSGQKCPRGDVQGKGVHTRMAWLLPHCEYAKHNEEMG